ncbi:MAG: DUF4124 domain-containing protein [Betaproteobacteria bacterium]
MNHTRTYCRALTALATALLLVAGTATATTYKWTDANGRVVYSDQPPPTNIKSEIVLAPPPAANAGAIKDLYKQEGEFKKRQMDTAENTAKAEAQRAEAVKRNEMCTKAQGQIRMLASEEVPLVRLNAKGESVVVDSIERRRERADLEVFMKTNCVAPR